MPEYPSGFFEVPVARAKKNWWWEGASRNAMCFVPADGWGFSAGGGSDTFPGGAGWLVF